MKLKEIKHKSELSPTGKEVWAWHSEREQLRGRRGSVMVENVSRIGDKWPVIYSAIYS